jgi:hypothetical protein
MMSGMRVYRVVVSIVVLIAIAISAPTVARARYRDQVTDVGAFDVDLELPVALDTYEPACSVIRSYVVVDETPDPGTCHGYVAKVLARAPKTSPPLV